jgi:dolichol kinase
MVEHETSDHADARFGNEARRKGFHFLSAAIPIGYQMTDYTTAVWVIGCLLGLAVAVEYARMASPTVSVRFHRIFGRMLRLDESRHASGATYLLLSSFLVILIFHKDIAILCLLFLVFGDGVAAIVGKKFGRVHVFGKTLEGTLAFAIASIVVSFFFIHIPFSIRLTGALTAAVIELLPMRTSDNLRIPIISGSLMEVLYVRTLEQLNPAGGEDAVVGLLSACTGLFS